MKNSKVQTKVMDNTKSKILYAGAALVAGLLAAALFSASARAETKQPHEEIKLPFELKSQKLSH